MRKIFAVLMLVALCLVSFGCADGEGKSACFLDYEKYGFSADITIETVSPDYIFGGKIEASSPDADGRRRAIFTLTHPELLSGIVAMTDGEEQSFSIGDFSFEYEVEKEKNDFDFFLFLSLFTPKSNIISANLKNGENIIIAEYSSGKETERAEITLSSENGLPTAIKGNPQGTDITLRIKNYQVITNEDRPSRPTED